METKEHIRKAAIKSFREQSAVGKLRGRHNFKEFNDYIAAFERGAEYILQSQGTQNPKAATEPIGVNHENN